MLITLTCSYQDGKYYSEMMAYDQTLEQFEKFSKVLEYRYYTVIKKEHRDPIPELSWKMDLIQGKLPPPQMREREVETCDECAICGEEYDESRMGYCRGCAAFICENCSFDSLEYCCEGCFNEEED